jgi:hypothetical protein
MRRILLALLLLTGVAEARSEKSLAYPRDQAWPAAVRFIRVDERLKVIEKDADAGYLLFEMKDDGKVYRGSLEVIDTVKDGRHVVRFVMTLEDRPSYLEIDMLNRLEMKLRAELGSPAPAPTPKKPDEPPPKKDDPPPKKDDGGPPISPNP